MTRKTMGGSAVPVVLIDSNGDVVEPLSLSETTWVTDAVDENPVAVAWLPKNAGIISKSANYELAVGDAGKNIECDGTFTINAPDGLPVGYQVVIVNVGAGIITVSATTTLQAKGAAYTLADQYGAAVLYHRGSNVWILFGDLT